MPVEWRLHVLEERLKRDFGQSPQLLVTDLYGVTPAERDAALDAMIERQGDFPIVLVSGIVACVSDIDADAITEELGRQLAR